LPAQFDLDPAVIERAFFDKSKELHPDRFANAPAAERVAALSKTRALNDAYQTLKKPVPRAEYLLERAGVTIGDNEQLDPTFLMEILELREELAEARVAKRTSEIEKLCGVMKTRRKAAVDSLATLFAKNDLAAIKEQLIVLRYLDRYLEECDAALDED
jgi:molecular chaperone HscB